jgi:hypothetical protein
MSSYYEDLATFFYYSLLSKCSMVNGASNIFSFLVISFSSNILFSKYPCLQCAYIYFIFQVHLLAMCLYFRNTQNCRTEIELTPNLSINQENEYIYSLIHKQRFPIKVDLLTAVEDTQEPLL